MDRPEIVGRLDPADRDSRRVRARLDRPVEVDLHVPVVPDRSQAAGAGHRGGRGIARIDGMAEARRGDAGQELGGPRLDPVEQRRADAASPLLGVDDAPRSDDVRLSRLACPYATIVPASSVTTHASAARSKSGRLHTWRRKNSSSVGSIPSTSWSSTSRPATASTSSHVGARNRYPEGRPIV